MRLIIAEKHSVGQAIAQALGGHAEKHNGYIEVGDDLVTWAQGHLVDLAAPDEYKNHDWGKWSLDTLPIDPTPDWQWKVSRDKGADRQYKVVAGLMRRDDVDMLVDACDPDREGEAIFRRITSYANIHKPTKRLWVASLEEEAIRQAFDTMKPESAYDGLAHAAEIRAKADWLIGMNASRAYSLAVHHPRRPRNAPPAHPRPAPHRRLHHLERQARRATSGTDRERQEGRRPYRDPADRAGWIRPARTSVQR